MRVRRGEGNFQAPPGWDEGFEFHRGPGQGPADHGGFQRLFLVGVLARLSTGVQRSATPKPGARTTTPPSRFQSKMPSTVCNARSPSGPLENDAQGAPSICQPHFGRQNPGRRASGPVLCGSPATACPGMVARRAGDLYLEVRIAPHPLYRVDGRDFVYDLAGHADRSRAGRTSPGADTRRWRGGGERATQCTQRLEVTPEGARPARQNHPATLFLLLDIALPPADSEAARAAYEQLAQAAPFNPRRHLGVHGA
jgi:curved DNA-binding protein